MSEQEQMDRLLAQRLAAPVPALSPSFDRRLSERLRPRRLDARGRTVLTLYCALAAAVSIWAMRQEAIAWSLVAASVVVPLVVVALVFRRFVRKPVFKWRAS